MISANHNQKWEWSYFRTEITLFIKVIYKYLTPTSQLTHRKSITKTKRLNSFREIITVYSESHIKHMKTLHGQNAEHIMLKRVVYTVFT